MKTSASIITLAKRATYRGGRKARAAVRRLRAQGLWQPPIFDVEWVTNLDHVMTSEDLAKLRAWKRSRL